MIQVTGHRGARDLAPENTLIAFGVARDLGCHAVELDVHLTKDGRLAVIHDATIDRTTNGHGEVSRFTMEELQSFDAGRGARIPSLEEVLERLRPTSMVVQIELKGPGTERAVPLLVKEFGMVDRVRLTSFFHRRVLEARGHLPEVRTGVLADANPVDPIHMLRSARADSFHVGHTRIDEWLVKQIHDCGLAVVAMGRIVDFATIDRLVALDVDVIGSDRPDLVIDRLKHHGRYRTPLAT